MRSASVAHHSRRRYRPGCIVRSCTSDDWYATSDNLDRNLDHAPLLICRHRSSLPGGAARNDVVNSLLHLPRDKPAQRLIVDIAGIGEWRDDCGAGAGEHRDRSSHWFSLSEFGDKTSSSVKTPSRPTSHLA